MRFQGKNALLAHLSNKISLIIVALSSKIMKVYLRWRSFPKISKNPDKISNNFYDTLGKDVFYCTYI